MAKQLKKIVKQDLFYAKEVENPDIRNEQVLNENIESITKSKINDKIHHIRGMHVIQDSDLAEIYGVETRAFNQAIKRNEQRFPDTFRFQLTRDEYQALRSQIVILKDSSKGQHRKYEPYVFTEQGVAMLSAVLKSKTAIEVSINIIQAFVNMRKFMVDNVLLFQRIDRIEKQQLITDTKLEHLFQAIENKDIKPKSGIFFDKQIFDAHVFVSDLIRQAKKSIILMDNYIDETVLIQLSKANQNVKIYLLTKNISDSLKLDIKKYNEQYANMVAIDFNLAHDRFLILDKQEIYHIGASLKDLGKRWFAFSKLETNSFGLMEQINKIMMNHNK